MNGKHKASHSPWPMVRLGDVGEMIRGSGIKRTDTVEKGFPCLRYGEIYTSYKYVLDQPRSFVPKEVFDKSLHIKSGDLVLTLTGETKEEIAKTLAYLGEDEIAAGGDLAVWTGHGCDPLYLAYLMYSPTLIKAKSASSNGNIIVHTSIKRLRDISIPIPPLPAQRKIVARLKKELAEVDRLSAVFKRLAALADEQFKSELDVAFKELYSGKYPMHQLKDHVSVLAGYPFKGNGFSKSGIKVCGGLIIEPERIRWENCKFWPTSKGLEDYLLQGDDVVLALDRPWIGGGFKIGKVGEANLPCLLIQRTARLRAHDLLPDYLLTMLRHDSFRAHCVATGTTVPHISHKDIQTFRIPYVPVAVQRKMMVRLNKSISVRRSVMSAATRGAVLCEELRKSILTEAFA